MAAENLIPYFFAQWHDDCDKKRAQILEVLLSFNNILLIFCLVFVVMVIVVCVCV